jgi:hypothetical protein
MSPSLDPTKATAAAARVAHRAAAAAAASAARRAAAAVAVSAARQAARRGRLLDGLDSPLKTVNQLH